MTDSDKHEGGCLCGEVRFEVSGQPELSGVESVTAATVSYDPVALLESRYFLRNKISESHKAI